MTMKQVRNPKTNKYPKSISDRHDTPQSWHPKNQEAKEKRIRVPKTKLRSVSEVPEDPLDGLLM
jgi:hypothetical protein